jgi:hypothetical protein
VDFHLQQTSPQSSTAWNLVVNQTVFVCLTYSLLQLHLLRQGFEELNRRTRQTTQRLLPDGDRVVIYRQQYFAFFTLMEHMELTLSLEEKARRKALAKPAAYAKMTRRPRRPATPTDRRPDFTSELQFE